MIWARQSIIKSSGSTLLWTPSSWFWGRTGQRLQVKIVEIHSLGKGKHASIWKGTFESEFGRVLFSQRFPLATSIVSRRSSRSYSHQTFWRPVRSRSQKNFPRRPKNYQISKIVRQLSLGEWPEAQDTHGEVTTKLLGEESFRQIKLTLKCSKLECLPYRTDFEMYVAILRTTSPMSTTTTQLPGATDGEGTILLVLIFIKGTCSTGSILWKSMDTG